MASILKADNSWQPAFLVKQKDGNFFIFASEEDFQENHNKSEFDQAEVHGQKVEFNYNRGQPLLRAESFGTISIVDLDTKPA